MQKKYKILTILICTVLLVVVIWLIFVNYKQPQSLSGCDTSRYTHINKDLVCSDPPTVDKKNYVEFKTKLVSVIQNKVDKGEIDNVSVYFRDLDNGPTFGIDEYKSFSPASLLKLPLFLTYLNLAEDKPELLDTEVGFKEIELTSEQYFPPKISADPNRTYTIRELLDLMIKYSDNTSYYVLREYLKNLAPDHDVLKETYVDLGIIDPKDNLDQTINVKSYGAIFSQLYHSSYLNNKVSSEYALKVLSETDFNQGLKQGLPEDIGLAHKFGERSDIGDKVKQLHDCGIVYYPGNPYLLCVMTQGLNFEKLSSTVGLISKMVYEEFDSRSTKQ